MAKIKKADGYVNNLTKTCNASKVFDGARFLCTLDEGHEGKHQAEGSTRVLHEW